MIMNPIYKKEMAVVARRAKLTLYLTVFNSILAVFALLYMTVDQVYIRENGQIRYISFLILFRYLCYIEFGILMLILPAMVAVSISGEREKKTLDFILISMMSVRDIVVGKLASVVSLMGLMIASSLPMMFLVFIYGGMRFGSIGMLFLCYFCTTFLVGSMGIFFSSCFRAVISILASYLSVVIIFGGDFLLGYYNYKFFLISLFNPMTTFYMLVNTITGNLAAPTLYSGIWFFIGCGVQLLLSSFLIFMSVYKVSKMTN
ncbi:hypothetical protein C7122_01895 [Lachnospiraceae bacterium oral taxon 096]|jgi:hypothetical protein|nr:hypothetical protein C7122_01895 [Lachnospiraceae bacterium oral taxon 096]QUI95953.1 hypothetical protein J5A74_00895 [Lachnospiraceae bacterium oral taxon 096]